MSASRLTGFPPVVDSKSKVLILGSMPGVTSLAKAQYYGHPQNQFWKILPDVLGEEFTADYDKRLAMIRKHGVALWDVVESCERPGSMDHHIRDHCVHDFPKFLKKYPKISAIFFDGKKAYELFVKARFNINLTLICLPSTSPAYTIPLSEKLKEWRQIKKYL